MRKQLSRTPTRQPTRHVAIISPRLNAEQRRALVLLAGAGVNSATETIMLARGFTLAMLGILVRKGLAYGGSLSGQAERQLKSAR